MGVYTYTYIHTYTTLPPPPPILNLLSPNPKPTKTLVTRNKKNPPLILLTKNRRQVLFLISLLPSCSSALAGGFEFVSPKEREASVVVTRRVDEAVELLEKGREFQAQGDFTQALLFFTQRVMQGSVVRKRDGKENIVLRSMVIERYKDLALSDYARVGRALALYEVGNRDDSIAEMEDVSISLKGYPEVHAALAAALYVDKHAPLLAENQFTIATLLDPRYTDISFVTETKHWPPSLEKERKRVTLR